MKLTTYQDITESRYGNSLYLLQGSMILVLLIGCMNVANLLVARGLRRTAEIAMRRALGAQRWVLYRQLSIECLVIGACSCLMSVLISWALQSVVSRFILS